MSTEAAMNERKGIVQLKTLKREFVRTIDVDSHGEVIHICLHF